MHTLEPTEGPSRGRHGPRRPQIGPQNPCADHKKPFGARNRNVSKYFRAKMGQKSFLMTNPSPCGHFEYKHFESQKKSFLGDFGPFLAIFGDFGHFGHFWPNSVPRAKFGFLRPPNPLGTHFMLFWNFCKNFWPILAQKDKNFGSGPQKAVFGLRRGFVGQSGASGGHI